MTYLRLSRLLLICAALFSAFPLSASAPRWLKVEIGAIGVASEDILRSAFQKSGEYDGFLIALDSPGGTLDATRSMVQQIMTADKPVIVWVGPSGAHAGSAGAFITLAGHVAAMAPATNIGAAHPVSIDGSDIEEQNDMRKKLENDTAAFMEAISNARQRNHKLAIELVLNSKSVSAEEALKEKLIDLIAPSPAALLDQLHEREVLMEAGESRKLNSKGAVLETYDPTVSQTILSILGNPNIFYLLFVAGLLGIALELFHPGVLIPGVLGGLSLILALIAGSVLPINTGALILMGLAIAFMVAEIFVPSFGILGIGGFIGFVIGSLLLIDRSESLGLSVAWQTIAPAAGVVLITMVGFGYLLVKTHKSRVLSGGDAIVGMRTTAEVDFVDGRGQVRLQGEIWSAQLAPGTEASAGTELIVTARDGLLLAVRPWDSSVDSSNT